MSQVTRAAVSTAEAREMLCLGRNAIYQILKDGRLRGVKVGARRWIIPIQAISDFLEGQQQGKEQCGQ